MKPSQLKYKSFGVIFALCAFLLTSQESLGQVVTHSGAVDALAPQTGLNNAAGRKSVGQLLTDEQKHHLREKISHNLKSKEEMQREIDSLRAEVRHQNQLLHKPNTNDSKPLLSTAIPLGPPPEPHLTTTPSDVELHPFPLPEQPTVDMQAQGTISPYKDGVRITFAQGSTSFNPDTHQAVLRYGQNLAYKTYKHAIVDAYSTTKPDDPSFPRRLSFARGLAARSILMNGGTPSTRIYVRVKGVPKPPNPPGDYINVYSSQDEHVKGAH